MNSLKPSALFQKLQHSSLLLAIVFQGLSQLALITSLPLLVETTNISYSSLILIIGVGALAIFFSAPYWSAKSDYIGRKKIICQALAAAFICHALLLLAVWLSSHQIINDIFCATLILLSRLGYGAMIGGLYPTVQALMLEQNIDSDQAENQSQQTKKLGQTAAAINIGRLLGPLLALTAAYLNLTFLLLILTLLPLLLLIALYRTLPDITPKTDDNNREKTVDRMQQVVQSHWQLLLPALMVTIIFGILQYALAPILDGRLQLTGKDNSKLLSAFMTAMALANVISHIIFNRWVRSHVELFLVIGGILLCCGSWIIFEASTLSWLLAGGILAAASVAMITPGYTVLAAGLAQNKGAVTGTFSMAHSAGYAVSGVFSGVLILASIDHLLLVNLACSLLLLLWLVLFYIKKPYQIYD